jgi:hypothetical protein
MTTNSVASFLQDANLRADWPKMSDRAYGFAVRLAAAVAEEMSAEPEDETVQPTTQFFVPFASMRREVPRTTLNDIVILGPRLMDFMNVITEVSGLAVVHVNDGLWFFDMRKRETHNVTREYFSKMFARVTDQTVIEQFMIDEGDTDEDDEDDGAGW